MKPTVRMAFFWMAIGVAIIWSVIGFTLIAQFRDLKSEFAELERRMSVTIGEVDDLQKTVRQAGGSQRAATHSKTEWQNPISTLSASDIQTIRQYIKVAPSQSTMSKLKVGDAFPVSFSLPMPKEVSDRLPKLRDIRFTIDQSGAIILSAVGDNRVAIVIGMTPAAKAN